MDILTTHMKSLVDEIGPRPTGSENNRIATDYCSETFSNLGYQVTRQEFSCMNWINRGAKLFVDSIAVTIDAAEYAAPCDVTGQLCIISTLAELEATELNQKICVLTGELTQEVLMPKNFTFYNPDHHQTLISLLEEKSPLAIITISFIDDVAVPIIQDGDFNIPVATLAGNAGANLAEGAMAHLIIDTERQASSACNIIATIGSGPKIALSAHIDTKPTTSGALDNASGVATLLTLAERLIPFSKKYTLEFTIFNGEDYYSMPGEMRFMQTLVPDDYAFAVNVDGVGLMNSKLSYSFYEVPEDLQGRIRSAYESFENIEEIQPWPMGDHMIYAMSGIPTVAFTASNIFGLMEQTLHTPDDNLSLVCLENLQETVQAIETSLSVLS